METIYMSCVKANQPVFLRAMNKYPVIIAIGFALLAGAPLPLSAQTEEKCSPPAAPGIPSGRSSTRTEMHETMGAVKEFIAAGNVYRACLDKVIAALGQDSDSLTKEALTEAYDDSLDTEELVADTFNTQLRIFRTQNN
jgi:hypothetical protein